MNLHMFADMTVTNFLAVNIALFLVKAMCSTVGKAISEDSPLVSLPLLLSAVGLVLFAAYFNISATIMAFQHGDVVIATLGIIFLVVSFLPFAVRLIFLPMTMDR